MGGGNWYPRASHSPLSIMRKFLKNQSAIVLQFVRVFHSVAYLNLLWTCRSLWSVCSLSVYDQRNVWSQVFRSYCVNRRPDMCGSADIMWWVNKGRLYLCFLFDCILSVVSANAMSLCISSFPRPPGYIGSLCVLWIFFVNVGTAIVFAVNLSFVLKCDDSLRFSSRWGS